MCREGDDPTKWVFSVGPRKGQKMIEISETGCWIWQGNKSSGYGVITYPTKRFPNIRIGRTKDHRPGWRVAMTHQLFYYMKHGNPPVNTELGHIPECSRRSCCHWDHVRPIPRLQNVAEMYLMPNLSKQEQELVEEMLLDDQSSRKIADLLNISVWSVRKIAQQIAWRDQLVLTLDGVPF